MNGNVICVGPEVSNRSYSALLLHMNDIERHSTESSSALVAMDSVPTLLVMAPPLNALVARSPAAVGQEQTIMVAAPPVSPRVPDKLAMLASPASMAARAGQADQGVVVAAPDLRPARLGQEAPAAEVTVLVHRWLQVGPPALELVALGLLELGREQAEQAAVRAEGEWPREMLRQVEWQLAMQAIGALQPSLRLAEALPRHRLSNPLQEVVRLLVVAKLRARRGVEREQGLVLPLLHLLLLAGEDDVEAAGEAVGMVGSVRLAAGAGFGEAKRLRDPKHTYFSHLCHSR